MAEKPYTIVPKLWGKGNKGYLVFWEGLGLNDTGKPYKSFCQSDKSVQIVGTLGVGGKCVIEGSNQDSSPVWAILSDPQGNALEISSLKIETILDNPFQVRPNITGGDETTELSVYMAMK